MRPRRKPVGHAEIAVLVLERAARLGDHGRGSGSADTAGEPITPLAATDDLLHIGRNLVGVDQRGVALEAPRRDACRRR